MTRRSHRRHTFVIYRSGGSGVGGAEFVPTDISGLQFWVKADAIVGLNDGDSVTTWSDSSGQGNDATQATAAKKPLYKTGGNTPNGFSAVRFDGSDDELHTSSFAVSQPYTIYSAYSMISNTGSRLQDGNTVNQCVVAITDYPSIYAGTNLPTNQILPKTSEIVVIAGVYNGVSSSIRVRDVVAVSGNAGANTITDGLTFGGTANELGGFFVNADLYEHLVYSGAHSVAEQAQIKNYLARWAIATPLAVFEGDSMTLGTGSTAGNDYPTVLCSALGGWSKVDVSLGGAVVTDIINEAATTVDPYGPILRSRTPVLCVWCGTNDLYASTAAATVYSNFSSYCSSRQAQGFKVVALTILPRSNVGTPGGFEADRQTVNTDIRTNWATFANALADVGNNSIIGQNGDSDNATYYGDKVHMTDAGYAIVANIVHSAILTI